MIHLRVPPDFPEGCIIFHVVLCGRGGVHNNSFGWVFFSASPCKAIWGHKALGHSKVTWRGMAVLTLPPPCRAWGQRAHGRTASGSTLARDPAASSETDLIRDTSLVGQDLAPCSPTQWLSMAHRHFLFSTFFHFPLFSIFLNLCTAIFLIYV